MIFRKSKGAGAQAPEGSGVIGRDEILEAQKILQEYKAGKANLEKRIIENEEWYRLRHWECIRREKNMGKKDIEPTSAWLFNCIENKHADAMDNFPSPNILPREEGDKAEAKKLSSILPVVLDYNDFENTYDAVWHDILKGGTGIYGVFWDEKKLNGLGDISIQPCDILSLFWEPGIRDIQQSKNLFYVELVDNDVLVSRYPQLKGKLGSQTFELPKYVYDDTVNTSEKSTVIDWYYKAVTDGKTVLHYCKFVNDVVLYATQNDTKVPVTQQQNPVTGEMEEVPTGKSMAQRGWYDHGMYPFVFDQLFPLKGTPAGIGYIDIAKSAQEYIDRCDEAIMQNTLVNARPRYFVYSNAEVSEEEFANMNNAFVHVSGNLGQDSIVPITHQNLSSIYVQVQNNKVDQLKETTGNRDISTGGTSSGVTAASAIAAMQEAGSKLSRDHIRSSYRSFKKICNMTIELIRQFYDLPRCFRIMGEGGAEEYIRYSNEAIQPQAQGNDFGIDLGYRIPQFDIEVTAQKQSPYSKMSQNELALQFYSAGFFAPQNADSALACLDMMDFDRKDFVIQKISQNQTLLQQVMMLQQQVLQLASVVDAQNGTQLAVGAAAGMGMQGEPTGKGVPMNSPALSIEGDKEATGTKAARQRVADSTSPR